MSTLPVSRPPFVRRRAVAGFTLIEIIIALAIVAILAAVALPQFFESMRKSRRAEGIAALTAIQQAQERWRANATTYTDDLDALRLGNQTPSGYYTLAISNTSASGYTATATAAGSQARDNRCTSLIVRAERGNIFYGSTCAGCATGETLTDSNRCWSRQ